MLGTTLEGLGGLAPDAAGGAAATGSTSGRKPKAYGARGKAERKDARRQARRLDQHQRQQAASGARFPRPSSVVPSIVALLFVRVNLSRI